MFGLVSGLYQTYFAAPNLNVLVVGESGVGKTTILERIKVTQFSTKSSMGANKSTNIVMERPERVPAHAFGLRLSSLRDDHDHDLSSNDIVASPASQKRIVRTSAATANRHVQPSSSNRQKQQLRSRSPTPTPGAQTSATNATTTTGRKAKTLLTEKEATWVCPAPLRYRKAAVSSDDEDDTEQGSDVASDKQQQVEPSSQQPPLQMQPVSDSERPKLRFHPQTLPHKDPVSNNDNKKQNSKNGTGLGDDDSSSHDYDHQFDSNRFSVSSMHSVELSSELFTLTPKHSVDKTGGVGSGVGVGPSVLSLASSPPPPYTASSGITKQPLHGTSTTVTSSAAGTATTHSSLSDHSACDLDGVAATSSAAATTSNGDAPVPVPVVDAHCDNYDLKPNHKMLPLQKIRPTMGMNLATVDICGAKCHFQDLSGKFQSVWRSYYSDCDAVIFVFRVPPPSQPIEIMNRRNNTENSNNNQNERKRRDENDDDDDDADKRRHEEEKLSAKAQLALLSQVRGAIADDVPFLILGHLFDQHGSSPQQQQQVHNAGAATAAATATATATPTPCQTDILYSTSALMPHYHNPLQGVFFARAITGQGIRSALEWLIPLAKRQHQERQQQNLHRYK